MRRLLWIAALPCLLSADTWIKFTSGPFEVMTDAGAKAGRETMVRFMEFRHAVGQVVGENELQTPLPVRILVFKNSRNWATSQPIVEGRDRYNIVLQEKAAVPSAVYEELTKLFLRSNTQQMPPAFEHGLVEFFSTFEVTGIHITVGKPPAKPDLDFARIHLLVTDPEYYGRARVLLFNLRKGADPEPAYRNAFSKSPAQIEEQAKQHLAAGNFQTASISSRPMAESDFPEKPVSDADARLARADLLAGPASLAEYQKLLNDETKVAEAQEGLGLLAIRDGKKDEARDHFAAAIQGGIKSARCYIEYAKLEPDNAKATEALLKAAAINPKLDEPFVLMAQRDTDPRRRLMHWKEATQRNTRNPSYWQALAECYIADHNYVEASKAWREGEQAATDPAVRDRMREARLAIEQQRLDYETAEKQRKAAEEARDLEKLKAQARAEVRALENKYNNGVPKSSSEAVPWWDGPKPSGKLLGMLKQVDCLSASRARLVIQGSDGKLTRLLVPDPTKISISGAGELTLGCGAQKPRRIIVEYFPKPDAKLTTAGEVATIEFQ